MALTFAIGLKVNAVPVIAAWHFGSVVLVNGGAGAASRGTAPARNVDLAALDASLEMAPVRDGGAAPLFARGRIHLAEFPGFHAAINVRRDREFKMMPRTPG